VITEQDWDAALVAITKALYVGEAIHEDGPDGNPIPGFPYGRARLTSPDPPEHIADVARARERVLDVLSRERVRQDGPEAFGRPGPKSALISVLECIEVLFITSQAAALLAAVGVPLATAKAIVKELRKSSGMPSPEEAAIEGALLLVLKNPARAWALVKKVWKSLS
jgi:hypothetical protein